MKKRFIIIGSVIIVAIVSWQIYNNLIAFRLQVVTPTANEIAASTPSMTFVFSKKLSSEGVIATMSPNGMSDAYVQDNKLTVNFNPLTPEETYTVTVKNIRSSSGRALRDQSVTFKVNNLRFDQLSKEQQDAAMEKQNSSTQPTADKAYQYLPHSTLDYTMTITQQNGQIVIDVDLLPSAADYRIDKDAAVAAYRKEAEEYLNSTGLDLNKYVINYNVVDPNL